MLFITQCPYCKTEYKHPVTTAPETHKKSSVVTCESEDGGCDNDFVIDYWCELKAKTREIK